MKKKNDETAKCSYCCRGIGITNTGEATLKLYAEGKEHKNRVPPANSYIKLYNQKKDKKGNPISFGESLNKRLQTRPNGSTSKVLE